MSKMSQNISFSMLPAKTPAEKAELRSHVGRVNRQPDFRNLGNGEVQITLKEFGNDFYGYLDYLNLGIKTIQVVSDDATLLARFHSVSKGVRGEDVFDLRSFKSRGAFSDFKSLLDSFEAACAANCQEPPAIFYNVIHKEGYLCAALELV